MNKEQTIGLLDAGKYFEAAHEMIKEYLGNNIKQFERDDIERRARILEGDLKDKISYLQSIRKGELVEGEVRAVILEETYDYASSRLNLIIPEDEIAIEEISSEDEDVETGVPIYKISSYPSDPTLEGLYLKKQRGEIIITRFQRGWVWTPTQASKLVDSFLLGLPVPSIFVYKESTGKQIVIDGQQRLRTIWGFFDGVLPDGGPFYLRGVSPQWEGKYYENLNESDKLRFRDSILRVVVVEQIDPKDTTSVYHIFERLNTGGTGLTPQEVRNCFYHGTFNDMIFEINEYEKWRAIFGITTVDARMRDMELIVRFLALNEEVYWKPMKRFLNEFMAKHQWEKETNRYRDIFTNTVDKVLTSLGPKPFHIKRGINVAAFDSVMVAFAQNSKIPQDIATRYETLISNPSFEETISESTTDTDTVVKRMKLANKALFH